MAYAKTTKVPVEKTISEIQKLLQKSNTTGFAFGSSAKEAYVAFCLKGVSVKMRLRLSEIKEGQNQATIKTAQQTNRAKARGLLLCIKAKIESVESGIETFEEAFLPHIILNDGQTVSSRIIPHLSKLNDNSSTFLLGMN
jgi:hypothetical protein